MNKFILVAMNRKNHTQEDLDENCTAAAADAADADAYAYAAAAYYAAAAADDAAADAAAAADDAAAAADDAEYWINRYFERTGEDKQLYVNEIERINNMKTVMDAVNEFEGVFTLEDQDNDDKMILEVIKEDSMDVVGELRCGYEGYSKEYRVMVCNESQFNDLVSQLETNFGESLSYKEYVSIQAVGASMVGKPSQPVFTQQKSVLMEESLRCIIAHLSEFGISVSNDYHAPSIDDLPEPQQKAKWVAMNALGMLSIDTRTDKEKAADEFIKDMTDSDFIKEQFKKTFLAGAEWAGE